MNRKFYLDTSIWRDYFEDRQDAIRPLGEFAFQFLRQCVEHNCTVFYSDFVMHELKKDYSEEQISQLFSPFRQILVEVDITNAQLAESKQLALTIDNSHQSDILHAILARDNDAILVARDNHFDILRVIATVMKPEEVYF